MYTEIFQPLPENCSSLGNPQWTTKTPDVDAPVHTLRLITFAYSFAEPRTIR
jgi:hypothetical protein